MPTHPDIAQRTPSALLPHPHTPGYPDPLHSRGLIVCSLPPETLRMGCPPISPLAGPQKHLKMPRTRGNHSTQSPGALQCWAWRKLKAEATDAAALRRKDDSGHRGFDTLYVSHPPAAGHTCVSLLQEDSPRPQLQLSHGQTQ